MAITTYAELKAAAANWLVRADLTARIPEFITLAEARLNRVVRLRQAVVEQVETATPGARRRPLPLGFGEALRLWLTDPGASEREELPFVEASLLTVSALPGRPRAWSLDGVDLVFDRPADRAYGVSLRWRQRYALSDAAPANPLLESAPDVYLFATLSEAGPFLRDAEVAGAYEAKLERAIAELNAKDARSQRLQRLGTELPELVGRSGCDLGADG